MKKRTLAALLACSVLGTVSVPAVSAVDFDISDVEIIEDEEHDKFNASFEVNADDLTDTDDKTYTTNELSYDKASGLYYYIAEQSGTKYAIVHGNPKVKKSNPNTTLKTLNIPSKLGGYDVKKIGDWGFQYYTALTNVVMPDTVLEVGISSFGDCYSLSSITFSKNLSHISTAGFENCVSLTSLNLPDSIESMYGEVFDGCASMTTIHIPANLDYVSSSWYFKGCPNLTTFTFSSSIKLRSSLDTDKESYGINGELDSTELYIPPTVTKITVDSGTLKTNPRVNYNGVKTADLVIACAKDSYAYKWAKENNIAIDVVNPADLDTDYDIVNWNADAGDVDKNGSIDALDASAVLTAYANSAVGKDTGLDSKAKKAADVNADGAIDALDASGILSYYAYKATGGTDSFPMYLSKN